jgi:hypothetical protein
MIHLDNIIRFVRLDNVIKPHANTIRVRGDDDIVL